MNKYSPLLFVMIFSFLFGDANVQIRLQNGQKANGEFVGTYMNHVHILVGEKIIYYACDDIISITSTKLIGNAFEYDCSKNTVTADILFPPQLDPMTGEMTQTLPNVFNPDIPKPAAKVEAGSLSTEQDFVVIGKDDKKIFDTLTNQILSIHLLNLLIIVIFRHCLKNNLSFDYHVYLTNLQTSLDCLKILNQTYVLN